MNTLSNVTGAARNANWGSPNGTDSTQPDQRRDEPLSGQTGNTKIAEPYDAGNIESTDTERTTATGNTEATDTSNSDVASNGIKQTNAPGNTAATGPIRPEHDTEKTGVTSFHQPTNAFASDRPTNSNDTSGSGPEPSVGADPASAPQNIQTQQGADRPHEEPSGSEHESIKAAKAEAEVAQNAGTSGPGPKQLSETHQSGGAPSSSEDDDGPRKESQGSGTGEQYVKSSGMGADGGDFDAANPGAGREADRLLEQKGVHREPGSAAGSGDKSDPLEDKLNKPSLGQKIKAKLHKT